ncbi:LytR C-terminal domain-containing protein [Arthrobacter sp. ISL-30]|uniref:LytR C-terminal domain-containing protein n=1 Tax=Arthrobacter sp. ISL-30 TaxID=2819109 RepID=UPI001BECC56B|nr:LytR C-terminal domain-containing protein [Arthrobacter sp. ISL-30]MBT2512820.1 LytR C-terminal domain-containing protein [Arthrobacter sp. ISL-30]
MTKYARDEFDRVAQNSSRQGVHRAATDAPRPSLVPILTVGIAALVIGLVCFLILPKLGFTQPAAMSSNVSAEDAKGGTLASETPKAETLATTSASASPQSTVHPSPSPTPTPTTAAVDTTSAVSVYNATTTGGLAARVAAQVQAEGWPLGMVANWSGTPQRSSVIFYRDAAQLGNAEALGKLLGITNLVESAEFQQPVVIILGPGFQ